MPDAPVARKLVSDRDFVAVDDKFFYKFLEKGADVIVRALFLYIRDEAVMDEPAHVGLADLADVALLLDALDGFLYASEFGLYVAQTFYIVFRRAAVLDDFIDGIHRPAQFLLLRAQGGELFIGVPDNVAVRVLRVFHEMRDEILG